MRIDMTQDQAIDFALRAPQRGATVTIQAGFMPPDDPDKCLCPWGTRGTADCAEFAPVDCSGRRCGVPAA